MHDYKVFDQAFTFTCAFNMYPDKEKRIMLIPGDLERTCIYLATD